MKPAARTRRCLSFALLATCGLGVHSGAEGAAATDVDDIAVRLQFAYYTADVRALKDSIADLTQSKQPEELQPLQNYYLAYGQWKLSELQVAHDKKASAKAAQNCETAAQAAAAMKQADEAQVLQAACIFAQRSMDITGKAGKLLQKAATLNPKNPRGLLVDALYSPPPKGAKDNCPKLQKAVQSFENAPTAKSGEPDWGYAEALARFAQCQMAAGNRVEARNTLEKSLVIAPDYRWARELLRANAGS